MASFAASIIGYGRPWHTPRKSSLSIDLCETEELIYSCTLLPQTIQINDFEGEILYFGIPKHNATQSICNNIFSFFACDCLIIISHPLVAFECIWSQRTRIGLYNSPVVIFNSLANLDSGCTKEE